MAPIFGAIFFARFPASRCGAVQSDQLSATKCSRQACLTNLQLSTPGPTMPAWGSAAPRLLAAPHNHTCGKFDLAHWNIIYQNFNCAAPDDPASVQRSAHSEETMTANAATAPSQAPSNSFRWMQLIIGVVCMAMIANLQYGWTYFVGPDGEDEFTGTSPVSRSPSAFSLRWKPGLPRSRDGSSTRSVSVVPN